jgi:signal transduction histidine kinase/ABC-type amino acid transport substrate-binding protein/ActR/RegA family two-component response regulator
MTAANQPTLYKIPKSLTDNLFSLNSCFMNTGRPFSLLSSRLFHPLICALLLISVLFPNRSFAQQDSWIETHPKLTLAFAQGFEPYLIVESDGSLSGFYVELIDLIEQDLGLEIEIDLNTWPESVRKARAREVDGLLTCTPAQARASNLQQATFIHTFYPTLFVLESSGISIQNLDDLKGKRVAHLQNVRFITDLLEPYAGQITTLDADSTLNTFKLLLEKKADVMLGSSFDLYQISQYSLQGIQLAYMDTEHAAKASFAIRDDWPETTQLINDSLARIGTAKINQLLNKWVLPTPEPQTLKLKFSTEELEWIKNNPTLHVITDSEGTPYSYENDRGQLSGILVDIFTRITEQTGIKFAYTPVLYDDIVKHVKAGTETVITGFDPPDYLESTNTYLKSQDITFLPFALYTSPQNDPQDFTPENMDGKKIAVIKGWDPLHPALLALGDCEIVYGKNELSCANMVLQGEADALFEVSSIMTFLVNRNLIGDIKMVRASSFGQPIAIWTHKKAPELHSITEKILSSMTHEEQDDLLKKWEINIDDPRYHLLTSVFTEEERNWLTDHTAIKVGIDPDWYPIEWQSDDGENHGLSSDYLNVLSEYTGLEIEYVPSDSWAETLDNIQERKIDMVPCAAIIDERKSFLNYTPPYLSLEVKIFVQSDANYIRDISELNGKTLTVAEDHAIVDLLKRDYPDIHILEEKTLADAVIALADGRADALAGDMLTTGHVINSLGIQTLKVGGDTPFTYNLAAGIRKDDPILASIISKALNEVAPETREWIYSNWAPLAPPPKDYSIIGKIGTPLILLLLGALVWNRVLKREVKRHTAALETEQVRLREAEVIAALGHWEHDVKSKKTIWSGEMYRILELPASTPPSFEAFYKLLTPEDRERIKNACNKTSETGIPTSEDLQIDLPSGPRNLIFQCRTVCSTGRKKELLIGTLQDITERVRIEASLFQSEKMQALGQLAGGVAHDFNNMLAGISGATEMMGFMLPEDQELHEYQSMILKSTKRASALTHKLLSFSRNQPIITENTNLHQLIRDTAALLKSSIDPRVRISLKLNAEHPIIDGDISALQNAILNIGINASHAMPDGGQLSISTAPALLDQTFCDHCQSSIKPGSYIEIDITDTGCGMTRETCKRIFEPFFTTKERGKGTGLGLASSLGTIEQHGGTINVHSEVNSGTSFHIFLPASPSATKDENNELTTLISGQGTVLLVEDDEVMRITASAILESLGYQVITADNGKTGLEVFKKDQDKIDMIMLDMIMPVMNGRDCFTAIKAIKPNACILLSTGFSDQEDVDAMRQQGLCGVIHKPYLSAELSKAVDDALHCHCLQKEEPS